ncbi:MAG: putative DNA-binding domain-containing protein [Verrucomicrobia bacterium]|nr:putative DNA-binding domain-containing protein [Verrucomicrobiota bacterium]
MKYDPKAPRQLIALQEWFGSAIRQRMSDTLTLVGSHEHIAGTQELCSAKRMQIYNEAYWFRLIDALQEEFPMLVRLFGEDEFTSIFAIEYLDRCPPASWNLNLIGDRFVSWLQEHYQEEDKQLVEICASLDWRCQQSFLAGRDKPLAMSRAESLVCAQVALQPTVHPFCLPGHFMKWRKELLEHPTEHWKEHPFPTLLKDKTYYYILYRSPSLHVEWEETCPEKYHLLQLISELGTIEKAVDRLEEMDGIDQEFVEKNIVGWIESLLSYGWLRRKQCR